MSACLPNGAKTPNSEEQLETLQDMVSACEVLLDVKLGEEEHWLTLEGQKFPEAVHNFSFLVARAMHLAHRIKEGNQSKRCKLPEDFVTPLRDAVRENHCHVATLNYDGLLSSALSTLTPQESAEPILFDGFVDGKFDRVNLFRTKSRGGWYLHLHGCPLFVDRSKAKPQKMSERTLIRKSKSLKNVGKHVVLTHFERKPGVIARSEILSTYWEFLERAIEESEEIYFFGYSGNDRHLNRLVAQKRSNKRVQVIEWLGVGNKPIREKFWAEQLGDAVEIDLREDVLTFANW